MHLLFRAGKKFKSLKDCLASSGGSSPVRERAGLSLSAVKSLVLREKDKITLAFGDNEKVVSLINSLFDTGICTLLFHLVTYLPVGWTLSFIFYASSCDDLSLLFQKKKKYDLSLPL